jgi:hypothetical protein
MELKLTESVVKVRLSNGMETERHTTAHLLHLKVCAVHITHPPNDGGGDDDIWEDNYE